MIEIDYHHTMKKYFPLIQKILKYELNSYEKRIPYHKMELCYITHTLFNYSEVS